MKNSKTLTAKTLKELPSGYKFVIVKGKPAIIVPSGVKGAKYEKFLKAYKSEIKAFKLSLPPARENTKAKEKKPLKLKLKQRKGVKPASTPIENLTLSRGFKIRNNATLLMTFTNINYPLYLINEKTGWAGKLISRNKAVRIYKNGNDSWQVVFEFFNHNEMTCSTYDYFLAGDLIQTTKEHFDTFAHPALNAIKSAIEI